MVTICAKMNPCTATRKLIYLWLFHLVNFDIVLGYFGLKLYNSLFKYPNLFRESELPLGQGRTETPSGPRAKSIFMAIWALFELAGTVGVGPLKWWVSGHCPNAQRPKGQFAPDYWCWWMDAQIGIFTFSGIFAFTKLLLFVQLIICLSKCFNKCNWQFHSEFLVYCLNQVTSVIKNPIVV